MDELFTFSPLPDYAVTHAETFPPDGLSEKELSDTVIAMAEAMGIWVCMIPDSRRVHGRGWPDLSLLGTRFVQVELKTSSGYRSAPQDDYALRAERLDLELYLWRPRELFSGEIYALLYEISPFNLPGYEDIKAMYPVPTDIIHPHDLLSPNDSGVSEMKLRAFDGAVILDNGPTNAFALTEAEYLHACYLSDDNYVGPVWDSLYEDGGLELIGWSFPHEDGTLFIPADESGQM